MSPLRVGGGRRGPLPEARQLDEGIVDTLVSVGGTNGVHASLSINVSDSARIPSRSTPPSYSSKSLPTWKINGRSHPSALSVLLRVLLTSACIAKSVTAVTVRRDAGHAAAVRFATTCGTCLTVRSLDGRPDFACARCSPLTTLYMPEIDVASNMSATMLAASHNLCVLAEGP